MVFVDRVVTVKTTSTVKKDLNSATPTAPVQAEKPEQETPYMNPPEIEETEIEQEEPKRGRKNKKS